jgi:hypothetical protein
MATRSRKTALVTGAAVRIGRATEHNVRAAVRELARAARVVGVSTFYQTAPIGHPDDPWVVNGVLASRPTRPPRRSGGTCSGTLIPHQLRAVGSAR